jgi:hypothetical protein
MTTRKKSRLLVDKFRIPRLIAEGRSGVLGMLADWEGGSPFANRMEVKALSANKNETVTGKKIRVEGESGNECGDWK